MSTSNTRAPSPLGSREGVLAALAVVDTEGWDGRAAQRLLSYVRSHIVRPQVTAMGLRGPAADQAEATGWAVAWETLAAPRSAPRPRRGDCCGSPYAAPSLERSSPRPTSLCRVARGSTWEAWIVPTERPTRRENASRQHRLRGRLATREIHGRTLDQWQYEVTVGGRIRYLP